MKMFIAIIITISLFGCGPSDQELQQAAAARMKVVMEQKQEAEKQINELNDIIQKNNAVYEDVVAQIVAEESRLRDIQGFQFLRTADEKEQQIKSQVKYIRELEAKKTQIEELLAGQKEQVTQLKNQEQVLQQEIEHLQ